MDQVMPVDDEMTQDEEEGSGAMPQIVETSTPQPSLMSRVSSILYYRFW